MTLEFVVKKPEAWSEIERILEGTSKLRIAEQIYILWYGGAVIGNVVSFYAEVKCLIGGKKSWVEGMNHAQSLLEKIKVKQAELEGQMGAKA